ncbi:nucleotide exchange factor GrpE [Geofilum rhodophaeum]|uniref:nucleotide exchange factor GrpE n=1 Tax=Geofilum rhodophaeum TaxID=1965019 RepID=UPI000B51F362|nr:nucleotide exchange factor GrpE [Geofilum rhodophaeum]
MSKKQAKGKEKELKKEVEQDEHSTESPLDAEQVKEENGDETDAAPEEAAEAVPCDEDRVAELEKQFADLNDKHLRLVAEYDNYRRRTLKEKMDLSKSAGEKIFSGMLPVVDDFERALQHLEAASDLEAVKEGISLIYNKFLAYLSRHGVQVMETREVAFDADMHEAVTKIPAPSEDLKGKILDCVEKGYLLDDKVIRFPKVVVGE